MQDFANMENDTAEPGGARAAGVLYTLYVVATAGLWIATAAVHHGWLRNVLEGLAIVFSALAVWAIAFVIVAFVKAASVVNARRRSDSAR